MHSKVDPFEFNNTIDQSLNSIQYGYKICKGVKIKINQDKFICWFQDQDILGVESFLLHSCNFLINGTVDENNINIIQQIKITLDQQVDMLSFNTNLQLKLLEFVAKYKDIKNNRVLVEILDI